jgi:hypothetical protein
MILCTMADGTKGDRKVHDYRGRVAKVTTEVAGATLTSPTSFDFIQDSMFDVECSMFISRTD